MSFGFKETELKVKDVMSSPVITVDRKTNVAEIAKMMREFKIGSVVVVNKKGDFLGIITKTDIIEKVLADKKDPCSIKAYEIMSSPILTVSSDLTLQEAAKIMRRRGVSRLGVTYKNKIVGVISLKDIIRVAPELIDLKVERERISSSEEIVRREGTISGYCESCGRWSDYLKEIDGKFYCKDCRVDIFGEED